MMAADVPDQMKTTQSWLASSKCALTARAARLASLMAITASGASGSHRHPASQGTTRSAMGSHDSAVTIATPAHAALSAKELHQWARPGRVVGIRAGR